MLSEPAPAVVHWTADGQAQQAQWHADNGLKPPKRMVVVDDTLNADAAYRMACEGTGLLWQGDFQNAKQLLQALVRRVDKPQRMPKQAANAAAKHLKADAFHAYRQAQAQRSRVLNQLLLRLDGDYVVHLRRAPDVRLAVEQAIGPSDGQARVMSLRSLQGMVGAFEWRKHGLDIPALGIENNRIHAHYGVFAPVRGEYLGLVAQAPLPAALQQHGVAIELGVGTGVLSALLVRRGVAKVLATDVSDRALVCANDNLARLGVASKVTLLKTDAYPSEKAALVVCNPPWLPARATSMLEQAVYDENSGMLRGFLAGLSAHLVQGGEGWLILSDLAELLGLRSRENLLQWIEEAGLQVLGRLDTPPKHGKVQDRSDPLHAARAKETTSLWRLTHQS
jgi:methylase of polypeptide subunit release factors